MKKTLLVILIVILGIIGFNWYQSTQTLKTANASEWDLKLVNVNHRLDSNFVPNLTTVDNGQQLDSRVVSSYEKMTTAAKSAGATLVAGSGYRSYAQQEQVLNRNIESREAKGMSATAARSDALKTVNQPGASEHQTGLAMDFLTPSEQKAGSDVTQSFAKTKQGKWLAANSWKYGWILRYPENEKNSTHISYESWHFRYVGKRNASYIYHHHLTLEQYIAKISN